MSTQCIKGHCLIIYESKNSRIYFLIKDTQVKSVGWLLRVTVFLADFILESCQLAALFLISLISKSPTYDFLNIFRKGDAIIDCVEKTLLNCKDPTPSNLLHGLLQTMREVTPCSVSAATSAFTFSRSWLTSKFKLFFLLILCVCMVEMTVLKI